MLLIPGLPSARLARLARDAAAALVRVPAADDTGVGLLPPAAVAELSRVVDASLAQASQRAYRADWGRFTAWATEHGYPCLPAPPVVVAPTSPRRPPSRPNGTLRYTPATLTRWVSSINQFHTAAGPGRPRAGRRWSAGRCPGSAGSGPPHRSRRAPLLLDDIRALLRLARTWWRAAGRPGWPPAGTPRCC